MPQPGQNELQADALAQTREAECVRLYSAGGYTLDQIAEHVGYANRSSAYKAIVRGLRKRYQESTGDRDAAIQRHLEITRTMIKGLSAGIAKGEPRAIEVGIQVLAREARMLGLDAPVRVDAKITDTLAAEIEDLVEQMTSMDAQQAQQEAAKARG